MNHMLASETLAGGVLFLLSRDHAKTFFGLHDDDLMINFITDLLDSDEDIPRVATDGTWETLHRCFSDGTLEPTGGKPPLNHCILGGRQMYQGSDRVVSLVRPDVVPLVAIELAGVEKCWLRDRYESTSAASGNDPFDQETFEQACAKIEPIHTLYMLAAEDGGAVVFAASL
jgi:hypothetical protein